MDFQISPPAVTNGAPITHLYIYKHTHTHFLRIHTFIFLHCILRNAIRALYGRFV